MSTKWLKWVRELQAMAQTGLTYTTDPYDRERYEALRRLAVEIATHHGGGDVATIEQLFTGEVGHATPKVDVRGALIQNEKILLVRERSDGLWTLPGGWADVGEPPSTAVVREVQEESGYSVRATKLAMLYDRDLHGHPPHPFHIYKLFFLCERIEDEAVHEPAQAGVSNLETDGVDFFAIDQLPPLSLSRITAAQIARLFDHAQHPTWPTDFD